MSGRHAAARLPWRVRTRSWWAGVGQPAWRRWARRVDVLVLVVTPLLGMAALLLTITQDSPAPAAGSCTLVGSTWSCAPAGSPTATR